MSQYKKIMLDKGIMQKEVLDGVKRVDPRVDKSLMSKIVNDVCLPTPDQLATICKTLSCGALDIYDPREIALTPTQMTAANAATTAKKDRGGLSHGDNIYNLTVEIPRDLAERVLSKEALRKLGYTGKTDFVRRAVEQLDKQLTEINKAAEGAPTPNGGK